MDVKAGHNYGQYEDLTTATSVKTFGILMNKIPLGDDELLLFKGFLPGLYSCFAGRLDWTIEELFVFGKWHPSPRLTCFYGDTGLEYSYSGKIHRAGPWPSELLEIKGQVEDQLKLSFNAVLGNWYRSGRDYMGMHQDNEKELGDNPQLASLSLGATRRFDFKNKKSGEKVHIDLDDGDLLHMDGRVLEEWTHGIPKQLKVSEGRINFTFRRIY